MGDVESINKKTGELSASGELAISLDLKEVVESVEGGVGPQAPLLLALEEMVEKLDMQTHGGSDDSSGQTHTHTTPEHTHTLGKSMDQTLIHTTLPPDHREEYFFRALSVFIQVCESGGGTEDLDLKGLVALTGDIMVSNLHERLAEKPAEEARYEVQQYFQKREKRDSTENTDGSVSDNQTMQADNKGWLLLKTLSLLTATDSTDSVLLLKPGLPAALVKCLYLLVCLPTKKEQALGEETFEELLTQVLVQLCSCSSSVKEMMETPELQCLIISLTSLHDQTSTTWRHQASRVLRAASAAKTTYTIPCLQAKNCVRICIQNLQQIIDRAPGPVLAELAATVFSFIIDSYQLNPALFIEFENNDGYILLQAILYRCEEGVSVDEFKPVEDLLALLASLCLFGRSELKVALCVTNPQPTGFKFDPSVSTGPAVKNLSAFRLLQGSFQRSEDSLFCSQILSTIRTVWLWNTANFFLLEWTVQSLTQVAQCVWKKPPAVHRLFFSMLEMVVFQLKYIPHEAVRAVQVVLKQALVGAVAGGSAFAVTALGSFHRLIVRSCLLAEVLSNGGLLELLLEELRRRAKIIRKSGGAGSRSAEDDSERSLTTSMLRVVAAFMLHSIKNTVSVRDLGMVPYLKIFLDEGQYRGPTLSILEQLAEINPDEFMSTAIGVLCSSTEHELHLKHDLLQSILKLLENPNCCGAFRRARGFTGLLSLVVDMEGALGDPGVVWGAVGQQGVLDLLLLTLQTLALAVNLDPVNSHHFQAEGYYEKLAEALLQLGCFQAQGQEQLEVHAERIVSIGLAKGCSVMEDPFSDGRKFYHFVELSGNPQLTPTLESQLPPSLQACVRLISYLDQFATGSSAALMVGHVGDEREAVGEEREAGGEGESQGRGGQGEMPQTLQPTTHTQQELQKRSRHSVHSVSTVCSENNYSVTFDLIILHPGAVRVILTLLPHVFTAEDPQLSVEVQSSIAHHLQLMVKSERNRQIICEGGVVSTLLTNFQGILLRPEHPLHQPITRILEKLASNSISPKDLRCFLCLSNPLMCQVTKMSITPPAPESQTQYTSLSNGHRPEEPESSTDDEFFARPTTKTLKRSFSLLRCMTPVASAAGQPLPLHQIISLVSMTSPRSFQPHRVSTSPAFVEFDMSESGYG
ncbi:hypothetical protein UPYG_G00319710 [Umbra pygmaea]|uniref:Alfy-like armadillo-like repeat domain-containing protein n=1 Tax=Umbra pygmaea TaxID=75934 RepID=A0ABD0W0D3_UMBPY